MLSDSAEPPVPCGLGFSVPSEAPGHSGEEADESYLETLVLLIGLGAVEVPLALTAVSITIRSCTATHLPPPGVQLELSPGEPGSAIDKNRNLRVRQNLLRFRAQQ